MTYYNRVFRMVLQSMCQKMQGLLGLLAKQYFVYPKCAGPMLGGQEGNSGWEWNLVQRYHTRTKAPPPLVGPIGSWA